MRSRSFPFISIIIPTHNRPSQLAACLEACATLDYPKENFEIIVVDDGGNTPLETVVSPFRDRARVALLRQDNAGPASARNRGAAAATGEVLAFTDDDCAPAPDWLRVLAGRYLASPETAFGGRTINALPRNLYSQTSQLLISYLVSYYDARSHRARFFPSSNLAFPAARFNAIGGFDATYPRAAAEDRELCHRWQHQGNRLAYAPDAKVYHGHELTLNSFLRQHFHYGRGALNFHRVKALHGGHRLHVEPPSFYFAMLRYPFERAAVVQAGIMGILLVLAQAANAGGFLWELVRSRAGRRDRDGAPMSGRRLARSSGTEIKKGVKA